MITNNIIGYDNSAKAFNDTIGKLDNYNQAYNDLLSYIKDDAKILDLACGPANISKYLLSKKPLLSITGMDLSSKMLEIAQQNIPQGKFICSNIVDFNIQTRQKETLATTKFDAIINGFGLPYLNLEEIKQSFWQTKKHLKPEGLFYISFMEGDKVQTEHPSFNPEITLTVTYHPQNRIESLLKEMGFTLLKKYNLDYKESDGSITTDVVIISQLNNF